MSFNHRRQRISGIARAMLVLAVIAAVAGIFGERATAQMAVVEWQKRQNADERLTAFGDDMFGEGIDPHTGGISFFHADVSLPGNSALDVSVLRRRAQGENNAGGNGEFGDWELRVPRMRVTTATQRPWTGNRCTTPFNTTFNGIAVNGTVINRHEYSEGIKVEVGNSDELLLESVTGAQWPAGATHVTVGNWYFTCGSASDGGQGFIGHAPNGDTYRFDRVIVADAVPLDSLNNYDLPRKIYILAATEVTDVSGNWVRYTYDGSGRLTQIHSSDGRSITLSYSGSSRLVQSVTANGRVWAYSYLGLDYEYPMWKSFEGLPASGYVLNTVTLPDNRQWTFVLDGMTAVGAPAPGCFESHLLSVTHPSGALAEFTIQNMGHRYVFDGALRKPEGEGPFACPVDYGPDPDPFPVYPLVDSVTTQVMSVTQKKVTGPSIPTAIWTYEYEQDQTAGTSGSDRTNWTKVTGPGIHITYIHNWVSEPQGGALAKKEVRATAGGSILDVEEYQYVTENAIGTQSNYALIPPVGSQFARKPRRMTQAQTTRGSDWWRTINTYDTNFSSSTYSFGLPLTVAKDSNVSTTARTTTTIYMHKKPIWVLGLPDEVSINSRTINKYHYDTLGRRSAEDLYGVRVADYTYHTNAAYAGAVHSVKDGINRTSYALNWKRGAPQQITQADGSNVYQTIDDNGWLTNFTDAKGFVTSYGRDSMGRLNSYTPTGWTATGITYTFNASNAIQTITKGSGRTTITYDNLWRPKLVKTEDLGSGWVSYVNSNYDALGRNTFTSYPSTSSTSTQGVTTTYDALGRTLTTAAPGATTTFAYLSSHRRRVTDPVGNQTTTYFSGYDGPDSEEIVRILQPMSVNTYVYRNVWGEVERVRQTGTQNGYSVDFSQYHYYNTQRQRCRHSTPEGGHTLFAYNYAGEMTSYQKGASSGTACTAPSGTAMVTLSYDLMGRPATTNFAHSGTPDINRGYDLNGNLTSVTRGISAWTYQHNTLNLLTQEKLVIDSRTYQTDYGYNSNGHLTQTAYPGGPTVTFAPDNLGRPTKAQASGGTNYATALQYHPNGALQGFTYGNGFVFSQTLTSRQMPYQVKSIKSGVKATDFAFAYRADDRISSITDNANTFASPWTSASYTYDAVNNLRGKQLGSRIVETQYDGSNRLSQMRDTATGNQWHSYTYDGRGNATFDAAGLLTIGYDYGDQPTSLSGPSAGSYVYDGNFKRAKQVVNGATIYSVYSRSGVLLHRDRTTAPAKRVSFIDVGGQTIAEVTTAGAATYFHNDQLGSPVTSTNAAGAVLWRETYTPYGESMQSDAAHADSKGFTGHVEDATGLTYMQARYYDPVVGRFLAVDPVEFSADRPSMFNRYAYANNNPITITDPTGTSPRWRKVMKDLEKDGSLPPGSLKKAEEGHSGFVLGLLTSPFAAMKGLGAGKALGSKVLQGAQTPAGKAAVIGATSSGAVSAVQGNDPGQVALDYVSGGLSSGFGNMGGELAESLGNPKLAGETASAFAMTKAQGGGDIEAAVSSAVTLVVGAMSPPNSNAGVQAGNVARTWAMDVAKSLTKEGAKESAKSESEKQPTRH